VKQGIVIGLIILVIAGFWYLCRDQKKAIAESEAVVTSRSIIVTETPVAAKPPQSAVKALLGETILSEYANTNASPQNDLTLMSHLMENAVLLLKSSANRPLSANEDWAAFLRGGNSARERFLPETHVALNTKGQLIDRWGTPLFFHALGNGRYDLRSAGPDKTMWTSDDIHRNADGSFRRGAELNPPSLSSK
jgi:hypothetical protein